MEKGDSKRWFCTEKGQAKSPVSTGKKGFQWDLFYRKQLLSDGIYFRKLINPASVGKVNACKVYVNLTFHVTCGEWLHTLVFYKTISKIFGSYRKRDQQNLFNNCPNVIEFYQGLFSNMGKIDGGLTLFVSDYLLRNPFGQIVGRIRASQGHLPKIWWGFYDCPRWRLSRGGEYFAFDGSRLCRPRSAPLDRRTQAIKSMLDRDRRSGRSKV